MPQALKNTTALIATLLVAALMTSCGGKDTHEKVLNDVYTLMEDMLETIESVKDKDSAEKAAKSLDKLAGKFEKVAKRAEALPDPDKETEAALKEKFEERGKDLGIKMMGMLGTLAGMDPEIMKIIEEPMEKINKAMEKVK